MKNKLQRKIIDKTGCSEKYGFFENVRIKVDQNSYFNECAFYGCTFIGRGKERAKFMNCINQ